MSQYIYQRTGGPILRWDHGAPRQSQAADARSLGAALEQELGYTPIFAPGSPEPMTGVADGASLLVKLAVLGGVLWIASKVMGRKQRHAGAKKNPARRRKRRARRARKRLRHHRDYVLYDPREQRKLSGMRFSSRKEALAHIRRSKIPRDRFMVVTA